MIFSETRFPLQILPYKARFLESVGLSKPIDAKPERVGPWFKIEQRKADKIVRETIEHKPNRELVRSGYLEDAHLSTFDKMFQSAAL